MTRSKAQASAEVRAVTAIRKIPEPPASLPEAARLTWDEVHSSVGPTHFRRGDLAMVARFCISLEVVKQLEKAVVVMPEYDPELLKGYIAMLGRVTALAGKLRLMPSTRELAQKERRDGSDPAGDTKGPPQGFFGGAR